MRANRRNNSQHCCANNVGSCCVRVGSGVQTDATSPRMLEELCKRIQHCCATLRRSRNKRNVGSCWLKSLTSFKLSATTCNRVCKRTQHVTSNNVESCWPTMLRSVAYCWMLLRKVRNRSNFSANNSQHLFCPVIAEA